MTYFGSSTSSSTDYETQHRSFSSIYRLYSSNWEYDNCDQINASTTTPTSRSWYVYVDDVLLIGADNQVKKNDPLEKQLQLKHVTKLQHDQPLVFLERQVEYYGDHIGHSMTKDYYDYTSSLATTSTNRPPIERNEYLTTEEHLKYRTIVGKLLWMCPLRPDIQYATQELTRA
eukprot:4187073-Amphidinium_carterae.1